VAARIIVTGPREAAARAELLVDSFSTDALAVTYQLLPGFLAAWVFYGLTGYEPRSPFERAVEALVFTVIVQAAVVLVGMSLTAIPLDWGPWNDEVRLCWSVVLGFAIGLASAAASNHDWPHAWLRWCRLTPNTSLPSEWYQAFSDPRLRDLDVILHLDDERRLLGKPVAWPTSPETGHIVLHRPVRLLKPESDRARIELLERVRAILVPVRSVTLVEFVASDAMSAAHGREHRDGSSGHEVG